MDAGQPMRAERPQRAGQSKHFEPPTNVQPPIEPGSPVRSAAELAALAAGCLVGLTAAGLLVRAGAPALLSGLTLFVMLSAAIAAAVAIAMRRAA